VTVADDGARSLASEIPTGGRPRSSREAPGSPALSVWKRTGRQGELTVKHSAFLLSVLVLVVCAPCGPVGAEGPLSAGCEAQGKLLMQGVSANQTAQTQAQNAATAAAAADSDYQQILAIWQSAGSARERAIHDSGPYAGDARKKSVAAYNAANAANTAAQTAATAAKTCPVPKAQQESASATTAATNASASATAAQKSAQLVSAPHQR